MVATDNWAHGSSLLMAGRQASETSFRTYAGSQPFPDFRTRKNPRCSFVHTEIVACRIIDAVHLLLACLLATSRLLLVQPSDWTLIVNVFGPLHSLVQTDTKHWPTFVEMSRPRRPPAMLLANNVWHYPVTSVSFVPP